jgi:phytol kinase
MHVAELVGFVVLIAALFASAEMLRRRGVAPDTTRRYTHATGASVAAVLPAFVSLAECVALGLLIAGVLAWTRDRRLLSAVHGVERPTLGAILLPLGLALAAPVGWPQPAAYALGALTLGLADPVAAVVGERVVGPRWRVWRGAKSLGGSVAFAAVVVAIGLAAASWAPLSLGPIVAIAVGLTIVEGSLGYGLDNVVVPPLAVLGWRAVIGL